MKRILIYACAAAIGAVTGSLAFRAAAPVTGDVEKTVRVGGSLRPIREEEVAGVRISRLISRENASSIGEGVTVNKAADALFEQRKSPMRTRAFLKHRVQSMSKDQVLQALSSGEIQTLEELAEAGRRLGREAPSETFDHLFSPPRLRIGDMDNLYSFINALIQTWCDHEPLAAMRRLQAMERGGSQQDNSLRFSNYWADTDPAAAARQFRELIYLRNMQDKGDMIFTDDVYAARLVKSWKQKDEPGLREYVGKLPAGGERSAFEKALAKEDEAKR